jgi:urea transport system ATP-binding protein
MLDGHDIGAWPSFRRCRNGIGYVPQGREIFSDLSVGENLLIAMKAQGTRDMAVLHEVCALFPVLRSMWSRRGGDLSGGQQQQLAIGRALMGRPRLLVLDEPTEGIQPSIIKSIETVIAALRGQMSILLVEQYYDFARSLADRYVVLSRGTVVARGAGAEMSRDEISSHISI